ncbi:helix-turn-helix transcriptional regulator [Arthrobacter sp. LAPM80]|uniref:helix-turn-helix transcriptional regulator n=1 Tax=Arthrobacter sp. LAPM80 TaxID=3141788 RepID=UPI00398B54FF
MALAATLCYGPLQGGTCLSRGWGMDRVTGSWLADLRTAAADAVEGRAQIARLIAKTIPTDQVIFADVDFLAAHLVLSDELNASEPFNAEVLLTQPGYHPAILSYLTDPEDRTPRRVSDVATFEHWTNSVAYREVFHAENSRYQLSMVTTLTPPANGSGWVLTRSMRDFTDDDVAAARWLLPLLVVFEELFAHVGKQRAALGGTSALTPRESTILACVGKGWTALRISRHLGISPRTVEKHLENVYAKLGCNDRLLAVKKAETMGLLSARR